ncbi:hypothetical protein [uncultured Nostoc sp.]|uniref:hypothetical protein n=1 Tax=uncultured Nostoc sp. TaxID=340711 RepID=UPI0035CAF9A4
MPSSIFNAVAGKRRLLPDNFPPWKTFYDYFRDWRITKVWQAMLKAIREQVCLSNGSPSFENMEIFIN